MLKRAARYRTNHAKLLAFTALAELGQGKLESAAAKSAKAVEIDSAMPEVHYASGCVLAALEQTEAAASAFTAAVLRRPGYGEAYRELGLLLSRLRRRDEAVDALQLAIRCNADDVRASFELAYLLRQKGEDAQALQLYGQVVRLKPDFAAAHVNIGNIALAHGKPDLAERSYRAAIAADPRLAEAHSNLGKLLKDNGSYEESVSECERAIKLAPDAADSHNNLANALKELGRLEEALQAYRRALSLRPDLASAHFNIADCYHLLGDFEAAEESYCCAIELQPTMGGARNNLALLLCEEGRTEEAVEQWRQALELEPDHPGYKTSLSRCYWAMGRYADAWDSSDAGFESGLRTPWRKFPIPEWQGEPLAGKRLLVWREQGIGDEIRFAGCYPDILALGGSCRIEAEPRLVGLFQRSFAGAEVVPATDPAGDGERRDADYHIPAGNLLKHFRRTPEAFPKAPYIVPDPERAARWQETLAAIGDGRKIGICWRSGLSTRHRDRHYTRLEDWGAILGVPGATFVNLQYDDCEEELREAESHYGVTIMRWEDFDIRNDMEEVFALASNLDLVISASTSVAEIAGSVGTETWAYQSDAPEPDCPPIETPWYGTLVWQRHWSETWRPVLDRIGASLSERLARPAGAP